MAAHTIKVEQWRENLTVCLISRNDLDVGPDLAVDCVPPQAEGQLGQGHPTTTLLWHYISIDQSLWKDRRYIMLSMCI